MYGCAECGYETPKWYGKCPSCGGWNSFEKLSVVGGVSTATGQESSFLSSAVKMADVFALEDVDMQNEVRFHSGVGELDRVLGGGVVKGSVLLLGGEPGIGKSTLLLQICQFLGERENILYVSGEESLKQIKLRAMRLGVDTAGLSLVASTNVEQILQTILTKKPDIVMIDSIQTMQLDRLKSSPGSVLQVRESTSALLRVAKSEDIAILIVGHVNKDGAMAGPKVLEHIVDAVLHFEGDRNQNFRILRAVKNRFGSTNEIGVFEMDDEGLQEVENPSERLLSGRPVGATGTCVTSIIEGTRPLLAEVQALACKTVYGMPRRTATGFDYNRLVLLLAVLEKRCGFGFSSLDAYLNVVGGLKLDEPAADLAVVLAFISSYLDKAIPSDVLVFGEIGLTGEVRGVKNATQRILEAQRLGFTRCILPKACEAGYKTSSGNLGLTFVSNIKQAVGVLFQ